jgi:hypothetical protein
MKSQQIVYKAKWTLLLVAFLLPTTQQKFLNVKIKLSRYRSGETLGIPGG